MLGKLVDRIPCFRSCIDFLLSVLRNWTRELTFFECFKIKFKLKITTIKSGIINYTTFDVIKNELKRLINLYYGMDERVR